MENRETPATSARACGICSSIQQIRGGKVANLIAELEHSYVVLGDSQFYRGYCLLLAKRHFTELFHMPAAEARALFDEMMLTAHAISSVVKPAKLNYACLGNIEPHVHWHIFPRQLTDPDPRSPVWTRPETLQKSDLEPTDKSTLIRSLQAELKRSASSRG